jgi:hypothetical protein
MTNSRQMLTPSGRFQPDRKICFSMSDFHPGTVRCADALNLLILLTYVYFAVESCMECRHDVRSLDHNLREIDANYSSSSV